MQKYFLFFMLLFSFHLSAQIDNKNVDKYENSLPKKYLDTNHKELGKISFFEKAKKSLFHYSYYSTNDTTYYHIQWSYYFGKLSSLKKMQLNKFLSNTYKIDTTKIITIHYSDTLRSINSYVKNDTIIYKNERKHRHLYSHKTFLKKNRECIKKFKRNKHSNVYHFYRVNDDHPTEINTMKWHKDTKGSLYKFFNINIKTFHTVVIHPEGKYYIYYYHDTHKPSNIYDKLIRNKKWDKYFNEFIEDCK